MRLGFQILLKLPSLKLLAGSAPAGGTKCPWEPHAGHVFETPGLYGCKIACVLKQTFAQCKNFLQGTLLVTNFTNLWKHIDK